MGGYAPIQRFRLDAIYYGATPADADLVYRTIHPVLASHRQPRFNAAR